MVVFCLCLGLGSLTWVTRSWTRHPEALEGVPPRTCLCPAAGISLQGLALEGRSEAALQGGLYGFLGLAALGFLPFLPGAGVLLCAASLSWMEAHEVKGVVSVSGGVGVSLPGVPAVESRTEAFARALWGCFSLWELRR